MRSSNPVFTRNDGFNGRGSSSGMTYPGQGASQAPAYGGTTYATQPRGGSTGYGSGSGSPVDHRSGQRMSIDSVVQKTGMSLGLVVLAAAVTWFLTGPVDNPAALAPLYLLSVGGALGGFALAMVNSFKRLISPPLVLAYAAVEGVFVGAFSKVVSTVIAPDEPALVIQAVVGTFAAVAGTLAAYKFFNITVTPRFRMFVMAAVFGMVALSLLSFVMSFFGAGLGVNGFGGLGLIFGVVGLVIGVFMLMLDFDFVERGIEAGLPERESWRAAFGLTVTIVWIYVQLLRVLAILRGGD